tara:strand:- start:722 stop:1264 length:543 start_codon:yes stop_codon:yes gene_type:complete
MSSIYLIANNPYYVNNNLKIPKKDDIIVRFNHGSINTLKLFNGITNILVFRQHKSGFHGIKNNTIINKYIKSTKDIYNINFYVLTWNEKDLNDIINKTKINDNIDINKIIISENMPTFLHKSPSSGFVFLNYIIKKYKNSKIYLVGWDFHKYGNHSHHDFHQEQYIVKILMKINPNIKII